jgi:hypothetical protein
MPTTPKYVPANGTTLSITPSGGTLTAIGQVVSITPASPEREEIDVSNLGSTWAETLLSIPDAGTLEFTIEWDSTNAGHADLWTNFIADPITGAKALWTVTFNDKVATAGTIVTFSGQVKSFPWDELENKKVATVKLSVRITGAITITPAV